jgi:hypothetical protein
VIDVLGDLAARPGGEPMGETPVQIVEEGPLKMCEIHPSSFLPQPVIVSADQPLYATYADCERVAAPFSDSTAGILHLGSQGEH